MICLHTIFYMPSSTGISIIMTKVKAKKIFAELPCCYFTFYKTVTLKHCICLEELLPYMILGP
jgi:hypothetical protein